MSDSTRQRALIFAAGMPLGIALLLPLAGLFLADTGSLQGPGPLSQSVVIDAMSLSLMTTAAAMLVCVLLGTPLAWAISRGSASRGAVDMLLDVPIVLPPSVVGVGLLLALTDSSPLGAWLSKSEVQVPFTVGAVVLAQVIISAPFYVRAACVAFRGACPESWRVARAFGMAPAQAFLHAVLPASFPQLVSGLGLAWARALGEFGATLIVAGNLPGVTQTAPLAVYDALEADLSIAVELSLALGGAALLGLVAFRIVASWAEQRLCPSAKGDQ